MKKFTQIPNWIIFNTQIPDASFRTYCVLKSFKYNSGNPFPSQATLSKKRSKSKKSIIEHLKILRNLGLIDYKKRGFSSSNKYQFIGEENHIDDDEEIITTKVRKTSALSSQNLQPNNTNYNKTNINNLRKDVKSYKERELNADEKDLLKQIVEWNTRPIFNTLLSAGTIEIMVSHSIIKYGYDKIRYIYDKVANKSYSPHPREFWNEIKALKEGSQ